MTLLRTTLTLYLEAAKDAVRAFGRSWMALGFLLIAGIAMTVLGTLASRGNGPGAGLLLGFVECFLIGTYLRLLQIALGFSRTVQFSDIRESIGTYYGRAISVGMAATIPAMILSYLSPSLSLLWVVVTSLAWNPATEIIYLERKDGFADILGEAVGFMSRNWPEWLAGQLLPLAPYVVLFTLLGSSWMNRFVNTIQIFGPYYGFFGLSGPATRLFWDGPLGIAIGVAILAVGHLGMLYRGALYARLARTNRRARAWAARAEGR